MQEPERSPNDTTDAWAKKRLISARDLAKTGDYRAAREEYLISWKQASKSLGPSDPISLAATLGNAKCLEKLRNHAGAAFNYKRYLDTASRDEAANPETLIDARRRLAWNYEQAGQTKAAHEEYRRLLGIMKRGDYSAETISALEERVACCDGGSEITGGLGPATTANHSEIVTK